MDTLTKNSHSQAPRGLRLALAILFWPPYLTYRVWHNDNLPKLKKISYTCNIVAVLTILVVVLIMISLALFPSTALQQ